LSKSVEGALRFFKDGNELLQIPSTDPLMVDSIEADHAGGNSNFNLKSSLKNISITGLTSSTKISRTAVKFDKKFGIKLEAKIARLGIECDYKMNGQILVLPIKGIGKANVSLSDLTVLFDVRGDFFVKDNETYINATSMKVKITPKKANYFFENIFNGDAALSANINSFMNENWEVVASTLLPGYEPKLALKLIDIANRVFNEIPAKMLFPE
jgi:hypothetical protein